MQKQTYTVELRQEPGNRDSATKTVTVTCSYSSLLGTIAEKYPGWMIVRYY